MKIFVKARDSWDADMQATFGDYGSVYDFPDDTKSFLELIAIFGRFEFKFSPEDNGTPNLEFQNDYD